MLRGSEERADPTLLPSLRLLTRSGGQFLSERRHTEVVHVVICDDVQARSDERYGGR